MPTSDAKLGSSVAAGPFFRWRPSMSEQPTPPRPAPEPSKTREVTKQTTEHEVTRDTNKPDPDAKT
jgi:hypothetical protein